MQSQKNIGVSGVIHVISFNFSKIQDFTYRLFAQLPGWAANTSQ